MAQRALFTGRIGASTRTDVASLGSALVRPLADGAHPLHTAATTAAAASHAATAAADAAARLRLLQDVSFFLSLCLVL